MATPNVPLESGRRARRSRCPDCHKLGVTVRFTRMEGEALGCRHCEWWAWRCADYEQDRRELMRWERENGNPGYLGLR